ncbi:MAG TPA: AfsR/SARP family transcriptional regulator [Jiangellales bacterium]|nr:AfsR/SARP family transcriptional regulator [Jiangellales bacterium]
MARLEFKVLGPLTVLTDEGVLPIRGLRQRRILAALLLECNRTVPVPRLVDVLWDKAPPRTATEQVRNCAAQLRRMIDAHHAEAAIRARMDGYAIEVDRGLVDAHVFETRRLRAQAHLRAGDVDAAATAMRDALDLWHGRAALEDLLTEPLLGPARRLDELRIATVGDYAELMLCAERPEAATAELSRHVRDHPYNERLHGQLARALHRQGRTAEALQTVRELRHRLTGELGVDIGPEVAAVEQDLLGAGGRNSAAGANGRGQTQDPLTLLRTAVAQLSAAIALLTPPATPADDHGGQPLSDVESGQPP